VSLTFGLFRACLQGFKSNSDSDISQSV